MSAALLTRAEQLAAAERLALRSVLLTRAVCGLHPDDQRELMARAEQLALAARQHLDAVQAGDEAAVRDVVARAVALCLPPGPDDTEDELPADMPDDTEYDGVVHGRAA